MGKFKFLISLQSKMIVSAQARSYSKMSQKRQILKICFKTEFTVL